MIPFNIPPYIGKEQDYLLRAINNHKICGDGEFTQKCSRFLEDKTHSPRVLLTTSGTHSLEMAARLAGINPGDEVILPSYTFSSTANAFVQLKARLAFIDINPRTMNMDETLIEAAITPKTKAIVPVHYAGVGCEMDVIMDIANKYGLSVIEDAAQGVNASYKNKPLGSIGQFGCFSFHETKNYSMGEGGALLINDKTYIEPAEVLREKGTDRSRFFRGQVDKYSWVDYGSSYLPSELNAAYLSAQLDAFDEINNNRLSTWNKYYLELKPLSDKNRIELPYIPAECSHNAHMFYIKAKNLDERTKLISYLKENGIATAFHYVPLHSAPAGRKFGYFVGKDIYTTAESDRLLRLPMYYGMKDSDIESVVSLIYSFYTK